MVISFKSVLKSRRQKFGLATLEIRLFLVSPAL
jgi:hypothetical protein